MRVTTHTQLASTLTCSIMHLTPVAASAVSPFRHVNAPPLLKIIGWSCSSGGVRERAGARRGAAAQADLVRAPHGNGHGVAAVRRHALVEQACGLALEGAEVEVVGGEELVLGASAVQLAGVGRVCCVVPGCAWAGASACGVQGDVRTNENNLRECSGWAQ